MKNPRTAQWLVAVAAVVTFLAIGLGGCTDTLVANPGDTCSQPGSRAVDPNGNPLECQMTEHGPQYLIPGGPHS